MSYGTMRSFHQRTSKFNDATGSEQDETNFSLATQATANNPLIKVYPIRFMVALSFGIGTILDNIIVTTYDAIQEESANYYNVSQQSINIISLLFQIFYIPGSIFSIYFIKRYELRKSFLFASTMLCIATIIRFVSVFMIITFDNSNNNKIHVTLNYNNNENDTNSNKFGYYISIFGTIFAAIVNPFYWNCISRVSTEWFATNERDIMTTIFTILNFIGFGCGIYIPTLFIQSDKNRSFDGFNGLFAFEILFSFLSLIITILFYKNKPPLPPSLSQLQKFKQQTMYQLAIARNQRQQQSQISLSKNANEKTTVDSSPTAGGSYSNRNSNSNHRLLSNRDIDASLAVAVVYGRNNAAIEKLKSDLKVILCENGSFWFLIIGFGCLLGFNNSISALINQYTAAFGYNSDNAGLFGLFLNVGGICGTLVLVLLVKFEFFQHKLRLLLKIFASLSFVLSIVFITQMHENNTFGLYLVFGIWGFFLYPIMTLSIQCAADCSYPIDDEISNTLLMISQSLCTVVLLPIWGYFLPVEGESYDDKTWNFSSYFIIGVNAVQFFAFVCFNGEMKRLHLEMFTKSRLNKMDISQIDQNVYDNSFNYAGNDISMQKSEYLAEFEPE